MVLISAGPMSQSAIANAAAAAADASTEIDNNDIGYCQPAVGPGLMEVAFVNGISVHSQVNSRTVQLFANHSHCDCIAWLSLSWLATIF